MKKERRKGKLKQDKYGRYHIRFTDKQKRVYHIQAPNNVFFNDELIEQSRGRDSAIKATVVPMVKRNLTPDEHLIKP